MASSTSSIIEDEPLSAEEEADSNADIVKLYMVESAIFTTEAAERAAHQGLRFRQKQHDIRWGSRPPIFKTYPEEVPQLALPPPDAKHSRCLPDALRSPHLDPSAPTDHRTLTLQELSNLCFFSVGITWRAHDRSYCKRVSPSSGALFSNELYFFGDFEGPDPRERHHRDKLRAYSGAFHYHPDLHALIDLEGISPVLTARELGMPLLGAEHRTPDLLGVFVISSILRRTGAKYHGRCYRYVACDTGHICESLRVAALEQGLHVAPVTGFDELQTAYRLGLDGIEEVVMCVLALSRTPLERALLSAGAYHPAHPLTSSHPLGLNGRIHTACSLVLKHKPTTHHQGVAKLAPLEWNRCLPLQQRPDLINLVDLPTALSTLSAEGVFAVARHRRSIRQHDTKVGVSFKALSCLLDCMLAVPPFYSDSPRIYLVANRVVGLESGVYQLHGDRKLAVVRQGQCSRVAGHAALDQEIVAEAAVVFILAVHRTTLFRDHPRGFRHAFMEVGMLSQRVLLTIEALGFKGRPVGAFFEDTTALLLNIDLDTEWCLHFIVMGQERAR